MNEFDNAGFSAENPYKQMPYTGKGWDVARYALPLMGLAEVIGTKGASQGQHVAGLMDTMRKNQLENIDKAQGWEDLQLKNRMEAIRRKQLEDELLSNKEMQDNMVKYLSGNPGASPEEIQDELFKIATQSLIKKGDLKGLLDYGVRAREAQANREYKTGETEENRKFRREESQTNRQFIANQNQMNRDLRKDMYDSKAEAKEKEKQEKDAAASMMKGEIVSLIDDLKSDPGFSTGLNPRRLAQKIPGSAEFSFAKKLENLKSRLSLDQRQKLKGQGQISDYEAKMLEKAASMLDMGLNKKDMIIELDRIRDIMNQQSGSPVKVKKVYNPKTGTFDTIYNMPAAPNL